MKKIFITASMFLAISIAFTSCGISKDVQSASIALVSQQKNSLEAHKSFHEATLNTLNNILDAEQEKNDKAYQDAVANYHQAMLDELKSIYENKGLSEADKKVKEEQARQKILTYIEKAETNKAKREEAINGAKTNLLQASTSLIAGEQAKSVAIEKLNLYLQAKRPSDQLLEMINLDLSKYSGYIEQANEAINKAKPLIEQIK